jgi:opacity protein-like surface antigen
MKWVLSGILCVMVVGYAVPASAQGTPKAEISAGYNYLALKGSEDDEWTKFPKGWYADVAGNVTETVSIVGQVTGNYKTFDDDDFELKVHSFMAGVRAGSAGRVRGFGQVLIGGLNIKGSEGTDSASQTNFAVQLGGGVTVMGSGNVGLRLGVDYLRAMAKDDGAVDDDSFNGFRFNVGVTFGIGSR